MSEELNGTVDGYPVQVAIEPDDSSCPGGAVSLEITDSELSFNDMIWIYFEDGYLVVDNGADQWTTCKVGE